MWSSVGLQAFSTRVYFQNHLFLKKEMKENYSLYEYRDLFIDMAVRNNRSKLAKANRHQER